MSADVKPPSPQLFFDTASAYQRTAALKAAIELDVFSQIGAGVNNTPALAKGCQASERGMRILCDYLTILGFLSKEGKGEGSVYHLTSDTALFLDRRSPAFLGSAMEFLAAPMMLQHYSDPAQIIRQGAPLENPQGTMAPEHPVWVKFARAMGPMSAMPAQMLAGLVYLPVQPVAGKRHRVLDIAAGHGVYGVTLAQRYPSIEVTACDWPQVLELAQETATAAGVAERWHKLPGSAFDVKFGDGYDIVLLTNFLHHFDPQTCEKLLRKIHAALADGGRLYTVDMVPNPDRISPAAAASFSFTMLASTPGGDAYTLAEFEQMFHNSGFGPLQHHPLPGDLMSILIAQKR